MLTAIFDVFLFFGFIVSDLFFKPFYTLAMLAFSHLIFNQVQNQELFQNF